MTTVTRLRLPSTMPVGANTKGIAFAKPLNSARTHSSSATKSNTARLYPYLLTYEELPEWYKDNEHIRDGYRPVSGSAVTSFRSLLYIHNETINIYSHLIPALAFIVAEGAVLRYLNATYRDVKIQDGLVFSFFVLTAIACLSLSACYHTLTNHSLAVDSLWLRMDFVGIVALTVGDFVSGIYMVFWCEPIQRAAYWIMVRFLFQRSEG